MSRFKQYMTIIQEEYGTDFYKQLFDSCLPNKDKVCKISFKRDNKDFELIMPESSVNILKNKNYGLTENIPMNGVELKHNGNNIEITKNPNGTISLSHINQATQMKEKNKKETK